MPEVVAVVGAVTGCGRPICLSRDLVQEEISHIHVVLRIAVVATPRLGKFRQLGHRSEPDGVGLQVLPGCRIVLGVPPLGHSLADRAGSEGLVPLLEEFGLDVVAQVRAQVGGPVIEGQIGQGQRRRVPVNMPGVVKGDVAAVSLDGCIGNQCSCLGCRNINCGGFIIARPVVHFIASRESYATVNPFAIGHDDVHRAAAVQAVERVVAEGLAVVLVGIGRTDHLCTAHIPHGIFAGPNGSRPQGSAARGGHAIEPGQEVASVLPLKRLHEVSFFSSAEVGCAESATVGLHVGTRAVDGLVGQAEYAVVVSVKCLVCCRFKVIHARLATRSVVVVVYVPCHRTRII